MVTHEGEVGRLGKLGRLRIGCYRGVGSHARERFVAVSYRVTNIESATAPRECIAFPLQRTSQENGRACMRRPISPKTTQEQILVRKVTVLFWEIARRPASTEALE